VLRVSAQAAPDLAARVGRLMVPDGRAFTALRYGTESRRGAGRARAVVAAALDRLEAELEGNAYLVGDSFTVADLTAACAFIPVVLPPQAAVQVAELPEPFERFRSSLEDRRGWRWVRDMFARHRPVAPAAAAGPDGKQALQASAGAAVT
jgi:glutathione S-transferase